jgi:hypothetical protein
MSNWFYRRNDLPPVRRQSLGRLFGTFIENTREVGGRTVEEAARMAGMELSEWAAIEAGHVPVEPAQMRSLAGGLELGQEKIALLALICRDAWEA